MIDRIKKIMEHYQMAPASFADTLKINRATLSHLFAGRNNPSLDMALKILEAFPAIQSLLSRVRIQALSTEPRRYLSSFPSADLGRACRGLGGMCFLRRLL